MDPTKLPRKLAGILYADVAGYARLTGEDEEGTHRRLSEYLDLIADAVASHQGRVVHYAGDAVLADFDTASDALACAAAVQRELQHRNSKLPEQSRVQFRIGVNLGEVIVDRDDIYGEGVNVAARLESLADPGGICIAESVRTAVGQRLPFTYEFLGERAAKNIAEPVRAYRVCDAATGPDRESEQESAVVMSVDFRGYGLLMGQNELLIRGDLDRCRELLASSIRSNGGRGLDAPGRACWRNSPAL